MPVPMKMSSKNNARKAMSLFMGFYPSFTDLEKVCKLLCTGLPLALSWLFFSKSVSNLEKKRVRV
jgi:hypothetical protein